MIKNIAYIGNFGFPNKNASGKRVLGNCKALQRLGYKVICISPGKEGKVVFDGIDSYYINRGNEIQRVLHHKLSEVKHIIDDEHVCIVIVYGALFTEKENYDLIKWCHIKGIKVIYDQVDWLDLNWHNPLRGIMRFCNQRMMDHKVIPECDGIICISNGLAEYHNKKGLPTVVIPPLSVEVTETIYDHSLDCESIHLVYAGTTSDINRPTTQWKDRVDIMFKRLLEVQNDKSLRPFQIDVYGMTKEAYIEMFPSIDKEEGQRVLNQLGDRVRFHGLLPNSVVIEEIRKADFTVLIRDKKRATMFGFPTKVSESVSCGTPVLCNDTSDIKDYIKHGITGLVMDDVVVMFKSALKMTGEEIVRMKESCLDNPFYYEKYCKRISDFIELVENDS